MISKLNSNGEQVMHNYFRYDIIEIATSGNDVIKKYYYNHENSINIFCIAWIFQDNSANIQFDDGEQIGYEFYEESHEDFVRHVHMSLLSKGYQEINKEKFLCLVEEKYPNWREKGEAEDREKKRKNAERLAAYRKSIHRTFKLAILETMEDETICRMAYFSKSDNPRLLIVSIREDGSACGTYTNGSKISYDVCEAPVDLESIVKKIRSEAMENGYAEISKEEFMKLIDEYYPKWQEEPKL